MLINGHFMGCYLWDWHCDDFSHHLLEIIGLGNQKFAFPELGKCVRYWLYWLLQ
ncbi:Uncharacterised protein [Mannheimia haemolytica]|uniref:Uncharacterized protein n=1 Tax=Mannheimia haemolytica TaxID=75985 RepID=A0A378MYI5_MANHA|nr:Uncharacterised protein [Mannheimia haemolytica]